MQFVFVAAILDLLACAVQITCTHTGTQSKTSFIAGCKVKIEHHRHGHITRSNIIQTVSRIIGPIAKPDKIQFVKGLPKTRSGKIMRRILRKIAEGESSQFGDTTTLIDPTVVDDIARGKL